MTIDVSNPSRTPWGEMDRATKAEILMQWHEGANVQFYIGTGDWLDPHTYPLGWEAKCAYRINPEGGRKTVRGTAGLHTGSGVIAVGFGELAKMEWEPINSKIDKINGQIDKSVPPRWVK